MKSNNAITFTEINDELIKDWYSLWKISKNANYINGPQWFLSVIEAYRYTDYAISCVYQNNRLCGIVAVVKQKLYGINVYKITPGDHVSGIPFLVRDTIDLNIYRILTTELNKLGVVILDNVPDHFIHKLDSISIQYSRVYQAINYYLPIKKDDEGEIVIYKKNKLINEAKKCLSEYKLKSYTGDQYEMLDLVFSIDEKSKKHIDSYNTFSDLETKLFYRHLATKFKNNFLISILCFRNIPVAYELGFLIKDVYTGSQIAYDFNFSKYTPGKVSELMVIESVASKNVIMIDYGSGDSHVKRLICQNYRKLYRVFLGKNKIAIRLLTFLLYLREYTFHLLVKNKSIYSLYKKVSKIKK